MCSPMFAIFGFFLTRELDVSMTAAAGQRGIRRRVIATGFATLHGVLQISNVISNLKHVDSRASNHPIERKSAKALGRAVQHSIPSLVSLPCSLAHPLAPSLPCSLAHPLRRSLAPSFPRSLTPSLSLAPSPRLPPLPPSPRSLARSLAPSHSPRVSPSLSPGQSSSLAVFQALRLFLPGRVSQAQAPSRSARPLAPTAPVRVRGIRAAGGPRAGLQVPSPPLAGHWHLAIARPAVFSLRPGLHSSSRSEPESPMAVCQCSRTMIMMTMDSESA
jgi:hypothetical protein